MAADPQQTSPDPRSGDRRGTDRRRLERRAPPPPWRRPWAYVGYGVLGGLALFFLLGGFPGGDEEERPPEGPLVATTPAPKEVVPPAATGGPAEAAYGAADFERLVIAGASATGRRVRAELYCAAPTNVAVQQADRVEAAVAALVDGQNRVPAADCKWGRRDDQRREDFVLLVPPDLADDFASTPVTSDDYVRRRRLVADVEWVGRSPALALRTAGVLRGIVRQ